ncbi:MAG: ribosome recycling factor [Deltaproteobacteria bacterium]|nr:ribosome recycling factor [Deltaproteobacteria bacterium]
MLEEVLQELRDNIEKAIESLRRDLSRLRTGRANLAILEGVRVDYYGVSTPLHQMSSMSTPDPRAILIKPWDRTQIVPVEKAILQANLGLTPHADGEFIRISVPALTEERRKELVKVIRKQGEEAKVQIRGHRRAANELIKELSDGGEVSEDDGDRATRKVQETTDAGVKRIDEVVANKEKDVLEV